MGEVFQYLTNLYLYHENKKVKEKKIILNSQEEYDNYIEEYKQMIMSKPIPFTLFIDNYFRKQELWKLPPLMDLVAPTLFKEEYLARNVAKTIDDNAST